MGVHMPPAGVVPARVAHGRIGVGWVPQKQASVTQCSVFSIALGATRMPSGHVCTPCTDACRPHADRPSSGASASKEPQFAARSLSAPHGCPLAACARRARMPSGHMRIARPLVPQQAWRRSSPHDHSRRHTAALWPRAHAAHGCPTATCGSPSPFRNALHGLHVAPWMPSGHMHASVVPP